MASAAPPSVFTEAPTQGATVETVYVGRKVKAFAVFDNEMDTLATQSEQFTLFTAAGTSLVSFAVGILTNYLFAETLTAKAEVATQYLAPILVLLAAVCYRVAYLAYKHRAEQLETIRGRSESAGQN